MKQQWRVGDYVKQTVFIADTTPAVTVCVCNVKNGVALAEKIVREHNAHGLLVVALKIISELGDDRADEAASWASRALADIDSEVKNENNNKEK